MSFLKECSCGSCLYVRTVNEQTRKIIKWLEERAMPEGPSRKVAKMLREEFLKDES